MARKKKTEEATAAVVDAAPVAEVAEVAEVAVETAAVVDSPPADAVEWPPNDAPDEPGEAPVEVDEVLDSLIEALASERAMFIPEGFEMTYEEVAEVAPSELEVERARLAELWRLNGVPSLKVVVVVLRSLIEGITSKSNVHRPARLGERELTTADLIAELERAGEQSHAAELRRWYRCNHRRAGVSIYVLLALAQLDEVADEQGQERAEGS